MARRAVGQHAASRALAQALYAISPAGSVGPSSRRPAFSRSTPRSFIARRCCTMLVARAVWLVQYVSNSG
jgi:hypothetical protein